MSQQPGSNPPANQPPQDPFATWRQWLTDSERQWNQYLTEMMSTEQYAQQQARQLDTFLDQQKTMNESMGRYFSSMNMPTRSDVLSLGDRLSAIEDRLISIESAITKMKPQAAASQPGPVAVPRPQRTRKPQTS